MSFTVRLSTAADEAVSVVWSTAHDTARSSDYTGKSAQTLTIAAGSTSGTIEVQTTEDKVAEGNEDFKVTLSEPAGGFPSGVSLGSPKTATGTITDDDDAKIAIADAEVVEGGDMSFTVTLSTAADEAVVVNWSTSHGTAGSDDYTPENSVALTIDAGDRSGTITVKTTKDTVAEGDETFKVTLSEPTSGFPERVSLGSDKEATGTIKDNDTAEITIDDAKADEGKKMSFTVTLSTAADEAVVVNWSTSDGTAGSDDYTPENSVALTIDAGDRSGTITVQTTEDKVAEGDETFKVTLSEPTSGFPERVSLGSDKEATGTITDDDAAEITIGNTKADEGKKMSFTVTLSTAADEAVSVTWSTAHDTAGSSDYDRQERPDPDDCGGRHLGEDHGPDRRRRNRRGRRDLHGGAVRADGGIP